MSASLTDLKDDNHRLKLSAWAWQPIIKCIGDSGLIDDERLHCLGFSSGVSLTPAEAQAIAQYLEAQVLPLLKADERLNLDKQVLTEPDDGTFYWDADEMEKNYSVDRQTLVDFIAFCRRCAGFDVY